MISRILLCSTIFNFSAQAVVERPDPYHGMEAQIEIPHDSLDLAIQELSTLQDKLSPEDFSLFHRILMIRTQFESFFTDVQMAGAREYFGKTIAKGFIATGIVWSLLLLAPDVIGTQDSDENQANFLYSYYLTVGSVAAMLLSLGLTGLSGFAVNRISKNKHNRKLNQLEEEIKTIVLKIEQFDRLVQTLDEKKYGNLKQQFFIEMVFLREQTSTR